jgi:hypothetical protein
MLTPDEDLQQSGYLVIPLPRRSLVRPDVVTVRAMPDLVWQTSYARRAVVH